MVKKADTVHVYKPHTLREALSLLKEYPSLRVIAGGTDYMQKLKEGAPDASPPALISLTDVDELTKIRRKENTVEIGAAVPLERIVSLGGRQCATWPHWEATSPWPRPSPTPSSP
jgi:CO/xanthine dehydrogenase FAD-binding subunit